MTRYQRRRDRQITRLVSLFCVALALLFCAVFARAMKMVDEPREPSEEQIIYLQNRDEEWFAMAEENEGEDPLESEHIEQAIIENPERRYDLTADELYLICGTVEHEAGNQPYAGKVAVAQCILNGCERSGIRPAQALIDYRYAEPYDHFSDETWQAVTAVFYEGATAVDDQILYFYNPDICRSDWHESMRFVIEIGAHRFFGLPESK